MSARRFFLDQDNSAHWYIVDAEYARQWSEWRDLPEDDPAGWDAPDFARRIDGGVQGITFEDPRAR